MHHCENISLAFQVWSWRHLEGDLEPLDLAIEVSLGEEGGSGKINFQASGLLVQSCKECVRECTELRITFPSCDCATIGIAINHNSLSYM